MKTFCRLGYRVPFSETDAMGIVHHSNHPRYLERGRIEFLRLAGHDYAAMSKRGLHFPVIELKVQYKKALEFDSNVLIETSLLEISRFRLSFSYKIFGNMEQAIPILTSAQISGIAPSVLGESFHCCVNAEGRPVEIEATLLRQFEKLGAL